MILYEITLNECNTAGAKLDSGHGRSSGPGWTRSAAANLPALDNRREMRREPSQAVWLTATPLKSI